MLLLPKVPLVFYCKSCGKRTPIKSDVIHIPVPCFRCGSEDFGIESGGNRPTSWLKRLFGLQK